MFVVGSLGLVIQFDGTTWSPLGSGTLKDLADVWGSSGDDVFAVGNTGTILHYPTCLYPPPPTPTPMPTVTSPGTRTLFSAVCSAVWPGS